MLFDLGNTPSTFEMSEKERGIHAASTHGDLRWLHLVPDHCNGSSMKPHKCRAPRQRRDAPPPRTVSVGGFHLRSSPHPNPPSPNGWSNESFCRNFTGNLPRMWDGQNPVY